MTCNSLTTIFFERLSETHLPTEDAKELIHRVVREYMLQLLEKSIIPLDFMEDVFNEIENEVLEMYRKKTYGFLTLTEYRSHHFEVFSKTAK